jgi:hypothetical protein
MTQRIFVSIFSLTILTGIATAGAASSSGSRHMTPVNQAPATATPAAPSPSPAMSPT